MSGINTVWRQEGKPISLSQMVAEMVGGENSWSFWMIWIVCTTCVCLGFAVMAAYLVYSVITVRKFYERNSERERLEAEKLK